MQENWNSATSYLGSKAGQAQNAFQGQRSGLVDSWTDSELRSYLLEQGIISPSSKREELLVLAKQKYGTASNSASSAAGRASNSASSAASRASNTASSAAGRASKSASSAAGRAGSSATSLASQASSTLGSAASGASQTASQVLSSAYYAATDAPNQAYDYVAAKADGEIESIVDKLQLH